LDQDHEVGARLVTFGVDFTFHIEDLGYWGPDLVMFHGVNDQGKKVELLQHVSQLSVLLVAIDKVGEKPRRVGFKLMEQLEEDEEDTP